MAVDEARDTEKAMREYKAMLRIRFFEKKVEFIFTRGLIHGTAHFYVGQEAVAVAACSWLNKDDFVTSTHRGHGHAIARGLPLWKLFAELMGRKDGFCGGRGGTQHIISKEHNFVANGITGGTVVTGTGIALAHTLHKNNNIVVSFFGDGAVNEGHFHEALNMAAVWKLPIVYVCENNLYAMSTHTKEAMVLQDIYRRAELYGMKGRCVDGNDLESMREVFKEAVAMARSGEGPVFVECKTYRHSGHSKNDQFLYRTREEEREWKQKDPLDRYKNVLQEKYGLRDEQLLSLQQEVEQEIEEGFALAEKSDYPAPETVYDYIWA